MDLEPGRCRRTDGKKWRCRLAVLSDQKYCERHIHRGCVRSRKPVEHHKSFNNSKSTATITVSPLKAAPNLQLTTKSDARNHENVGIKNPHSFKIKKRSREDALELTSPKSVLQNGNVQNLGTSSNNNNNTVAIPESERCRRTDGKNWRCTKGVLKGQKYCAQHMHRGAKKVQNSNSSLLFSVGARYQQKGNSGNQLNESNSSDNDDGGDGSDAIGATESSSSSDATTISM